VQGLNNYLASAVSARYWLNKLYPKILEKHILMEIFTFMI